MFQNVWGNALEGVIVLYIISSLIIIYYFTTDHNSAYNTSLLGIGVFFFVGGRSELDQRHCFTAGWWIVIASNLY